MPHRSTRTRRPTSRQMEARAHRSLFIMSAVVLAGLAAIAAYLILSDLNAPRGDHLNIIAAHLSAALFLFGTVAAGFCAWAAAETNERC